MKQIYAKNVFLSFVLQVLENGRSFLLIPVIAKTIGAYGYGIWIQVKIGIAFLCPFLLMGMGEGILRFLPGSPKNEARDGIFSSAAIATITGIGLAVLIIFSEEMIQKYFEFIPDSGLFIKAIALLCVAEPINMLFREYFLSFRKMKTLLGFSVCDTIFEFVPVFWFAYNGFGIAIVIFAFACGRFIMAVIKTISIFLTVGLGNYNMDLVFKYVKFGFPLIWAKIFFFTSNYIDRYLLGFFYSAKEVGIYSLAYSVAYTVVLMSAPWDRVLTPTITEHWNKGDKIELSSHFNHTLKYILIAVIPAAVYLSITGRVIVRFISTMEFISAVYIIPIMLATFIIFEIGIFYQRIVKIVYDSNIIMKVYGVIAIISVIFNLILIPRFSIMGAAVSLLFTYSVFFVIFYYLAKKSNNIISFKWSLFLKCLLATVPGCIFIFLNKNLLFFRVVIAIFLYFSTLWILGTIGRKETDFLKRLLFSYRYK